MKHSEAQAAAVALQEGATLEDLDLYPFVVVDDPEADTICIVLRRMVEDV